MSYTNLFTSIKNRVFSHNWLIICTTLLLLLFSGSTASAATITVDDSGGACYANVRDVGDNANGGDVSDNGIEDMWGYTHLVRVIANILGHSV
jgi:hypothetical protein